MLLPQKKKKKKIAECDCKIQQCDRVINHLTYFYCLNEWKYILHSWKNYPAIPSNVTIEPKQVQMIKEQNKHQKLVLHDLILLLSDTFVYKHF